MNLPSASLDRIVRGTSRPIYQQIKDSILSGISRGDLKPGEQVPSEHVLVKSLGASRMTVNRALRELTQQGHLVRVHGVGTFVAQQPRHASLIELRNIADEIQAQGKRHRAEIKMLERTRAKPEIRDQMQVTDTEELGHIVIVHHQNDVPIQLEDRYVNMRFAPQFLHVDFENITPTRYLLGLCNPDEIEHIVQAVLPDRTESRMLSVTEQEPCLRLLRRTFIKSEVVTLASMLYPGSRYDLMARYAAWTNENLVTGVTP